MDQWRRSGRCDGSGRIQQQSSMGHRSYQIPLGGSNVVGTTAYVKAMEELACQLDEMSLNLDAIVFASGSGGTQAGIVLGAHLFGIRSQLYGISVSRPANELKAQVGALATATAAHLRARNGQRNRPDRNQ